MALLHTLRTTNNWKILKNNTSLSLSHQHCPIPNMRTYLDYVGHLSWEPTNLSYCLAVNGSPEVIPEIRSSRSGNRRVERIQNTSV